MFFSSEAFSQNLYINIYGENDFETSVIDSLNYTKKHQDYNSILNEVASVKKLLYKKGFIENEFSKIVKESDSLYVTKIQLKKQYHTTYIYYDESLINKSILNLVSTEVFDDHFILPFQNIENSLNIINSKIAEEGFPFSSLKLSDIEIFNNNHLKANLVINSNSKQRTINDIVIKGYENFPRSFLKHYLKINPSQVFNLSDIEKKTEQLNDLRFANQIKTPEVLFAKDSTTLYLYIEKAKSNTFDGFLGFGTNESTNKIEFDGYLNLNLINNLNFGETFSLLYKSDENEQKTFRTNLSLPYLFKTPIGVDLQLQIFKKDSSFTTVNQSAKVHYQINSKHKVFTGITATQSNNLLNEASFLELEDYNSTHYTLAYEFIKPQSYNLLFPINSKLFLETGFGNRKLEDTSLQQTLLFIDGFNIFNLNNKNSIYLRVNGSSLISDNYLDNELLRFGGINSIRGFEENSLYASLFGLINTEYRYQLNNSMFIHSIIDAAYFENKIIGTKEKLFGFGFGLGLLTKAGLFKLNYANGKPENQKFKFSNSKIHLSLLADF